MPETQVTQQQVNVGEEPNASVLRWLRFLVGFAGLGTMTSLVTAVLFVARVLSLPGKVEQQSHDIDTLRQGQRLVTARQDTVFRKLDRANGRLDWLICIRQGHPEQECTGQLVEDRH